MHAEQTNDCVFLRRPIKQRLSCKNSAIAHLEWAGKIRTDSPETDPILSAGPHRGSGILQLLQTTYNRSTEKIDDAIFKKCFVQKIFKLPSRDYEQPIMS